MNKTHILISIKKPWSQQILTGEKAVELRKVMPRKFNRDITLWIYESGNKGAKQIIGKCDFTDYLNCDQSRNEDQIKMIAKYACVTLAKITSYMPCYGWLIYYPVKLNQPISLTSVSLKRPPQSWMYLSPEQASILERQMA